MLQTLVWWLWLALLVSVPITTFPLVRETVGGDTVSPLSLFPLILLVPLAIVPRLIREGSLPTQVWPLAAFTLVAILSAAIALFYSIPPFKGQTVVGRGIWGLGTIGVGLGFYVIGQFVLDSDQRIRASLQALTVGAIAAFLWGSVQAWYVLDGIDVIPWQVNEFHRMFSVRDLFRERVTGLAYEPSWFGNQLALLYLPIWLGAVLSGYSAFPRLARHLTLEILMIIWGLMLLFLGKSRLSIASAILLIGVLLMVVAWRASEVPLARIKAGTGRVPAVIVRLLLLSVGAATALGLAWGTMSLLGRTDWRVRRISTISNEIYAIRDREPYEVAVAVANRAAFAERVVFWHAGLRIFEDYPILGVGPGNSGFLLAEKMSMYGWGLTEIRQALDPSSPGFPNTKSLWVRLLSETGIAGFSAFASWVMIAGAASIRIASSHDKLWSMVGYAGALSLTVLVLEGFSLETFALPHMWLVPGMVTALVWRMDSVAGASLPVRE